MDVVILVFNLFKNKEGWHISGQEGTLCDSAQNFAPKIKFDVDTIIEEIDELAVKRDSSPIPDSHHAGGTGKSANNLPPNMQSTK